VRFLYLIKNARAESIERVNVPKSVSNVFGETRRLYAGYSKRQGMPWTNVGFHFVLPDLTSLVIFWRNVMNDKLHSTSKKITYTVNGTVYNSIDDVPPEFREMIRDFTKNGTPQEQVIESNIININGSYASSGSSHRDKFLRDVVYPNLHLMDKKTIKTVMKEVEGSPKGVMSFFAERAHLIWINFVFALWASVAYYLYLFVWRMMHPEVMAIAWGPWDVRAITAPFWFASILVILWFTLYRERNKGSRLFAFMTGLMMVLTSIVALLRADMMDRYVNLWQLMYFIYFGVSNFLYAVVGKEYDI
jgi:hypothetical protein